MSRKSWIGCGFGLACVAALLAACSEPFVPPSNEGGESSSSSTGGITPVTEGGPTTIVPSDDTTSGGEVSTGNDDGNFIEVPDGGIEAQCDLFGQDCPAGQKCTSFVSTPGGATVDASHCVKILGDDQWGETCQREDGNDSCAPGLFCMTDVSGNVGEGTCFEYCQVGSPCEFGGECFPFNNGQLPLCEVECNPLVPNCQDGQGCYAAFESFVCARPGFPEGGGGDGDVCATIQGCQPGLICGGGTAGCKDGGCCTPVCEIGVDECIEETEECVLALDPPPPGFENVGLCTVPQ